MDGTTYLFQTSYFSSCQMLMAFSCWQPVPYANQGTYHGNVHKYSCVTNKTKSASMVIRALAWIYCGLPCCVGFSRMNVMQMFSSNVALISLREKVHWRRWDCRGVWVRGEFVSLHNVGSPRLVMLYTVGDLLKPFTGKKELLCLITLFAFVF